MGPRAARAASGRGGGGLNVGDDGDRKPTDTNNNTAIALALGEMRGELRAEMRGMRTTVDGLASQGARTETLALELGTRMVDFHTRLVAVESSRPRLPSLNQEAVSALMATENKKQSESIRAAAIEANQPVVEATNAQTLIVERRMRTLTKANFIGAVLMALILGALNYLTSHH